jgi:hypothetical protein
MPAQSPRYPRGRSPMRVMGISKRLHGYGTFRSRLCYDVFSIDGITKDSAGTVLGGCTLDLFDATTDAMLQTMVSDANGVYSFQVQPGKTYYIVAYKTGAPDLSGTTINTLTGV